MGGWIHARSGGGQSRGWEGASQGPFGGPHDSGAGRRPGHVGSGGTAGHAAHLLSMWRPRFACAGEITQQMLKNASFPGSNNGTGLFQTIVGLKVRDVYERIVQKEVVPV